MGKAKQIWLKDKKSEGKDHEDEEGKKDDKYKKKETDAGNQSSNELIYYAVYKLKYIILFLHIKMQYQQKD